jgi:hypothetical protein
MIYLLSLELATCELSQGSGSYKNYVFLVCFYDKFLGELFQKNIVVGTGKNASYSFKGSLKREIRWVKMLTVACWA